MTDATEPADERESKGDVHLPGYARRDWRIVDYQLERLQGTNLEFRGPIPRQLEAGSYIACIGAAQTFGCFTARPFATLLGERLGMPALNLGYGGAGPSFFSNDERLLDVVNGARLVVVQVMSARSESNSEFESEGLEYLRRRSDGRRLGAVSAYDELIRREAFVHVRVGLSRGVTVYLSPPKRLRELIAETRENWIRSYDRLLERIRVPKILFYFSQRPAEYRERYHSVLGLFGEFPQLVNGSMVHAVRQMSDAYVECVTRRGIPQVLVDRFTGRPTSVNLRDDRPDLKATWKRNRYYPSPEMHEDAAAALEHTCRQCI